MTKEKQKIKVLSLKKHAFFSKPEYAKIKAWFEAFLAGSTLLGISSETDVSSTTVRTRMAKLHYVLHHTLVTQPDLITCVNERYPNFNIDILRYRMDRLRYVQHEVLYAIALIENCNPIKGKL